MTGTPIRQGVIDLYAPLHLVDPNTFSNYWAFVNKYCITIQTPFGKSIERNPKNIPMFRQMLNKYMVRRLKSEVLKDLPGKQRNAVPLTMTPAQEKAYKSISQEMMYVDDVAAVIAPNQMTVDLRLRQLLVTPRLLGIDEDGAGFNYLSEVVPDLLLRQRPVVIFTPFRQAIPLLADLIKGWGLGTHIHTLTGGMTPVAFANEWQSFQDPKNKNKVMLCVIKSGASFHATESADCYFLGYEWDFNLNVQAEDRLCRLGQQNFVQCNYFVHDGDSIDENVKARLNEKQLSSDFIIGSEKQFREIMRKVRGIKE
jgi:SNF2 family DNA or RNA helicase